jgi:ABC-2 type transport system ATP-binding protein
MIVTTRSIPAIPGDGPMIEVSQLRKGFDGKEVLRGIDFTIRPGEAAGYLGPNGAGKSTTVKILAGLLGADSGRVLIAGFDPAVQPLEVKRRIGYVPESAALYPTLTPHEYLSLVSELYHLERTLAADRIAHLLLAFQIAEAGDRPIETLSKGMRQKVLLSAALLHDPEVLLLDEPLGGLDVHGIMTFRKILEKLLERGRTILFCSHILEVVERLCSRVLIIDQGRIVADDSTAGLLSQEPRGTREAVFQALVQARNGGPETQALLDALGGKSA